MVQRLDTTCYQINNWRWDHPHAFRDHVDFSNLQTTNSGMVKCTGERSPWYHSNDPSAKIQPPSCWPYKPGNWLAVRQPNSHDIIDEDDDDENWPDPRAPSGGWSRPGNDSDNDNGEGEEDMQGGENATGKGKGTQEGNQRGKATQNGKRKWNGNGKGNSKVKGIVKQTPRGDDISRAVA